MGKSPGSLGSLDSLRTIKTRKLLLRRCRVDNSGSLLILIFVQGNVLISNILQKDYRNVMMSCALHPGGIKTECHRHEPGYQRAFFDAMFYPLPSARFRLFWREEL
jgi:hypothetical protein